MIIILILKIFHHFLQFAKASYLSITYISANVAKPVILPPNNTDDMGANLDGGRYIVVRMCTKIGGPLSLVPIPSGRLKTIRDIDIWPSLRLFQSLKSLGTVRMVQL